MNTKAFLSWCATQGVSTPLQLSGTDSYRYLASNSDVTGDIIRAPIKACLTADTSEALAEILKHEHSLGSKSKYAPYIDMLPTIDGQLSAMPRFWSQQRIETVTDGGQMEKHIMKNAVKEVDQWALACVSSRVNFLDDFTLAMTPMLDMLNHNPSIKTKAKITDGELYLGVDESFAAGQEVFISYGELTNLETLCDYGFISPVNICNSEDIDVRIIRRAPVPVKVFADGSISNSDLKPLRASLATLEEIESQQGGAEILAFAKPVSSRNEEEVLALLSVTLDDAATEAKVGAQEATGDDAVSTYLSLRAQTLQKGLTIVEKKLEEIL